MRVGEEGREKGVSYVILELWTILRRKRTSMSGLDSSESENNLYQGGGRRAFGRVVCVVLVDSMAKRKLIMA